MFQKTVMKIQGVAYRLYDFLSDLVSNRKSTYAVNVFAISFLFENKLLLSLIKSKYIISNILSKRNFFFEQDNSHSPFHKLQTGRGKVFLRLAVKRVLEKHNIIH